MITERRTKSIMEHKQGNSQHSSSEMSLGCSVPSPTLTRMSSFVGTHSRNPKSMRVSKAGSAAFSFAPALVLDSPVPISRWLLRIQRPHQTKRMSLEFKCREVLSTYHIHDMVRRRHLGTPE
jgi:hypothetical protein